MRKKTIGILATGVALCALCVVTDTSAFARGAGEGHGGAAGGRSHRGLLMLDPTALLLATHRAVAASLLILFMLAVLGVLRVTVVTAHSILTT